MRFTIVAWLLTLAFVSAVAAGPPTICHPVDIGDAKSLPFGKDAFAVSKRYNVEKKLVRDTIALLDGSDSALVHMETLRRATIYVRKNQALADKLMSRILARTLDAEVSKGSSALAWFDAGYLAQCYDQIGLGPGDWHPRTKEVRGYVWVLRALTLRGDDAEMEFAAAVMTVMAPTPHHDEHAARVRKLARDGALVDRNIRRHTAEHWRHFRTAGR
jgi:hypothetical protein